MNLDQFSMEGRVALITGASSEGIGKASARVLAEAGANVFLIARREDRLAEAVEEIKAYGVEAGYCAIDVSDPEQCKRAITECVSRFGRLDVIVLAHGINGLNGRTIDDEFDMENYRNVLDINLDGVFYMLKYGHKECAKSDNGSIILVNSLASLHAAGSAAYTAAKGAIKAWTKFFAKKLAPEKIRVNAVIPGLIETEMTHPEGMDEQFEKFVAPAAQRIPLRRLGQPEDIANGVLYLASDASQWVTGSSILIDGGEMA
ncbi:MULTISPECIES: SDR family NAD(P)-dependent oxidoreductase [unclassified Adlercreutzia]|uniref:SDR family NAD(P)-dependent oxidoreductase n=1 Tax=unclassified Adlercreutzia TaxID=2636013 RepID=UPI0013EA1442|nr:MULTISPECIES: glucose 1-dehydrogenase [unclassified Adlercreutzia]